MVPRELRAQARLAPARYGARTRGRFVRDRNPGNVQPNGRIIVDERISRPAPCRMPLPREWHRKVLLAQHLKSPKQSDTIDVVEGKRQRYPQTQAWRQPFMERAFKAIPQGDGLCRLSAVQYWSEVGPLLVRKKRLRL
jgi:hypothetical protein